MADVRVGFQALATRFDAPAAHINDPARVSVEELGAAADAMTGDGQAVAIALVTSTKARDALRLATREGAFNDSRISMADVRAAARDDSRPARAARSSVAGSALFDPRFAAVVGRYATLQSGVTLGSYDQGGVVAATLALSPPGTIDRYRALDKFTSYGSYDNGGLTAALLVRNGDRALARFKAQPMGGDYGSHLNSGLVRALLATGSDDAMARYQRLAFQGAHDNAGLVRARLAIADDATIQRYNDLSRSGLDFGTLRNAAVVRAQLAVAGGDAVERYRGLKGMQIDGSIDNTSVARALIATGRDGTLERFRAISGVELGSFQNAGIVRAVLARGPEGTLERYRQLVSSGLSFGSHETGALAAAMLASGESLDWLAGAVHEDQSD